MADDVAPIRFGDLGRYQLRAMTAEEIALTDEPFSKTVVEWNWNDRKTDLIPEIGEGEINKYGATQGAAADFNNVVCSGNGGSTKEQKGLVANGGITFTQQWWDFDADKGKYFDISFSTQGISGSNMVFGIVWGHGSMSNTTLSGPAHWNLLYSVDGGATFQAVPDSPIIKKRRSRGGRPRRRIRPRASPSTCANCPPTASAGRKWFCACRWPTRLPTSTPKPRLRTT